MADSAAKFTEPDVVIKRLVAMDDISQARIWRIVGFYGAYTGSAEDLYQEACVRILEGKRRHPSELDIVAFFSGVVRSIANEVYEKNKKEAEFEERIPLDDTFWGNKSPETPYDALLIRRSESASLPDGFLREMLEEAKNNDDTEIEKYLIHSIVHGDSHQEIVSMTNWSDKQAQAIQKRAARLIGRHVESFKSRLTGGLRK